MGRFVLDVFIIANMPHVRLGLMFLPLDFFFIMKKIDYVNRKIIKCLGLKGYFAILKPDSMEKL